jgi:hypothetical protein
LRGGAPGKYLLWIVQALSQMWAGLYSD